MRICDERGVRPTRVILDLGLSRGNLARWKSGVEPKLPILRKMADYFGVSLSELTGEALDSGEITPEKPGERSELTEYLDQLRERPEMRMLFSVAKDASKEDVEAIVRFVEALNER